MTRRLLWLGFALSLAGNVCLLLLLLNAGSIVDDAKSEAEILWKRRALALEIIRRDWVGRRAEGVDKLGSDLKRQGVLTGHEGEAREIGDFIFDVKNGVVVDVRDLDTQAK